LVLIARKLVRLIDVLLREVRIYQCCHRGHRDHRENERSFRSVAFVADTPVGGVYLNSKRMQRNNCAMYNWQVQFDDNPLDPLRF
jgi:hypothetical protein